jgi:hypothetical protein
MSYRVTVINKYHDTLMAFGSPINKGDTRPVKLPQTLGNGHINVPGIGSVNFIDIADKHLGGYSKATWGVLISYQGEEMVFRYEGGGEIEITINQYGQAEIKGNGAFSQIRLNSFELT